jgi:hypothetical protein
VNSAQWKCSGRAVVPGRVLSLLSARWSCATGRVRSSPCNHQVPKRELCSPRRRSASSCPSRAAKLPLAVGKSRIAKVSTIFQGCPSHAMLPHTPGLPRISAHRRLSRYTSTVHRYTRKLSPAFGPPGMDGQMEGENFGASKVIYY